MTTFAGKRISLLAGIFLAASLGGCAEIDMPDLDQPRLYLEVPVTWSNLPRGDYVITNGQGEVLLAAKDVKPVQEHEARFDNDKLDGTLVITAQKDGKTIYTQTVHHPPGVPVKLEWDINTSMFHATEAKAAPRSAGTRGGGGDGRD